MPGRIGRAVQDIRKGRFLEAYASFMLGLVVVGLDLFSAFSGERDKLNALVLSAIIIILGVIAFASIELRRDMPNTYEMVTGHIWRFFSSRDELPSLENQVEQGWHEIYIYGLQLGYVVHNLLPTFERKAREDCRIRLALLSPVDKDGTPVPWIESIGYVHHCPNLREVLYTNLRTLRFWYSRLDARQQKNIEIRAYAEIPTASMMFFDPDRSTGYVHIEPILHMFDPPQRPSLWIRERDDPTLVRMIVQRYRILWLESMSLNDLRL